MKKRCSWCEKEQIYIDYHDHEWGMPIHDDQKLFEFIILEGMQSGLSWLTVLKKRENFRLAFDYFDPLKIAHYDQGKIASLMQNPGIIRNHAKITATIKNARAFLHLQEKYGSFDNYIWRFTEGKTLHNAWHSLKNLPNHSPESDAMAKDLKCRGFSFIGTTTCYAHMQATGMINDHLVDCFRYSELKAL